MGTWTLNPCLVPLLWLMVQSCWKKWYHGGWSWRVHSLDPFPVLSSCFVLVVENMITQLFALTTCCHALPTIMDSPSGTIRQNKLFFSLVDFSHGVLSKQRKSNWCSSQKSFVSMIVDVLEQREKEVRSIVQKAGGRQRSESRMVSSVASPGYWDILILSQTQKTGMCMLILGSERRCVFLDQELGGPVSPSRHRLTMT